MLKLVEGVHAFQKDIFAGQKELFARLARGQAPTTLFITCSDSRISPNLLTQTAPGELFILRNAGNLVPSWNDAGGAEAAAIEFALVGLGVQEIVICGHSHCGAVKGLLNPASLEQMPSVRTWLKHAESTRRVVLENYPELKGEDLLNVAIQENVLGQIEHLRTHPAVAARLASGKVRLHGWVYKLETGEVFAFEPEKRQFLPLANVRRPAVEARSVALAP